MRQNLNTVSNSVSVRQSDRNLQLMNKRVLNQTEMIEKEPLTSASHKRLPLAAVNAVFSKSELSQEGRDSNLNITKQNMSNTSN